LWIRDVHLRRFAVTIRLQNSHDFRPRAMPRTARSAALLDKQMRLSSRNSTQRLMTLAMRSGNLVCFQIENGQRFKRNEFAR
jgi:hypothetical protein